MVKDNEEKNDKICLFIKASKCEAYSYLTNFNNSLISFLLRTNNKASTNSGNIEVLLSVTSFFEILNNRSQLACDAGIAR